jgi:nicotinate-nucleotide pyrophosphorylase (carboxylating)
MKSKSMTRINDEKLLKFIADGLFEDVHEGDHTSLACVPLNSPGKARLLVKDDGIIAGVALAEKIFKYVDPYSVFHKRIEDGTAVKHGYVAFYVEADSQAILKAERLVLNCMQRMSGIATLTNQFTSQIADLPCQLLDTRKTTPLFRFIEKWAVRIGGGTNYREGLYDRIMIKDNHTDFSGGLSKAIERAHTYMQAQGIQLDITVEVRNMAELEEVLQFGRVNRIMLDNFDVPSLKIAVDTVAGRFETEASGGITLETIRAYAETGVNFVSSGALTHSFYSLDMSLKYVKSF